MLYVNDMHEAWEDMARVVTGFDTLSQQAVPNDVLRFNAGDTVTGEKTEPSLLRLAFDILRRLRLHGATLGNHELMSDPALLAREAERSLGQRGASKETVPLLVSNLRVPARGAFHRLRRHGVLTQQAQIVTLPSGQRYGMVGVTRTAERHFLSHAAQLAGLDVYTFANTQQQVQEQIQGLLRQGVDRVVVISHLGLAYEQALAQAVPGIDVIIGGDSHDALAGVTPGVNWFQPPGHDGPTLLVQAGKNAQFVGVADVVFNAAGQLAEVRQNQLQPAAQYAADAKTLQRIRHVVPAPQFLTKIPETMQFNAMAAFQPLSQWIADEMRRKTGADVALLWTGNIRHMTLPKGTAFTTETARLLLPYDSPVVMVTLRGDTLAKALAHPFKTGMERLFYPAGLHYEARLPVAFHPAHPSPAQPGALLGWPRLPPGQAPGSGTCLDPKRRYRVALTLHNVATPSEFPDLATPSRLVKTYPFTPRHLLIWYLEQHRGQPCPLPLDEGRIRFPSS
jgi:5'-nucleotidase